MNQFRIVADSSCDLLTLDGADFISVPLSIRTDAEEFYDDTNLDVDAMVSTLRDTKGVPTVRVRTSQTGKAHSVRAAM